MHNTFNKIETMKILSQEKVGVGNNRQKNDDYIETRQTANEFARCLTNKY